MKNTINVVKHFDQHQAASYKNLLRCITSTNFFEQSEKFEKYPYNTNKNSKIINNRKNQAESPILSRKFSPAKEGKIVCQTICLLSPCSNRPTKRGAKTIEPEAPKPMQGCFFFRHSADKIAIVSVFYGYQSPKNWASDNCITEPAH